MNWDRVLDRLREGGLHIVSKKGHGKTVAKMNLARLFSIRPDCRVIIFDTLPNWVSKYDCCPYITIEDRDVLDRRRMWVLDPNVSSYIVTEKRYQINKAKVALIDRDFKTLLYNVEVQDPTRIGIFESEVISYVYNKQRILAKYKGIENLEGWYVFIIEESENVFDSSSLERRAFNRIRKQYSESANLKICFISSSQRLQEVSTKFRGKMNYLIGKCTTEDYDLKIRRLLRHSKHREKILSLPIGAFLNTATDEIIQFPEFKRKGKKPFEIELTKPQPTEIKPTYPKKKKGFWHRLIHGDRKTENWENEDDSLSEEIDTSHEENEFIPI